MGSICATWLEAVGFVTIRSAERRAPSAEAMTAPRARERSDPPSPPDRRPPRRGGGSSPSPYTCASAAGRAAGPARLPVARRGLVRSARALAAAALLALSGALALPATAQADVLVSNLGQDLTSQFTTSPFNQDWLAAKAFSVPSGGGDYTLTSIEIPIVNDDIAATDIGSLSVSVWSADTSGKPSSSLHPLTNPSSISNGDTANFNAQAGATLEAGNTYVVVVDYNKFASLGAGPFWRGTASDAEDATSTTGWTIANTGLYRARTWTSWSSRTYAFGIRVNGTAAGGGTPANNPPVFSPTSTTREVAENSVAGTNVGAVIPAATDADTGDTLTYSMAGTDAASFAFDASTRQITTIAGVDLNHEATKNSYSVTVKASDGTASATMAVTIDVTDVNEKSAAPDKPTLAKVTGSSTSLVATWTKPDLDGGPEITGYLVQYWEAPDGSLQNIADASLGLTRTITGLTADTSYQVHVRTLNGEAQSDWSDASDAVKTNAAAALPTLSIGDASATEGSSIRFPLTLSAAASENVTVTCTASFETGDTAVAADFSSTTATATITAGGTSGSCSIRTAQDTTDEEDETFTVTLSGVSSNAQLAADPTATGTIEDDDTAPTISTVVVTSTPVLDTDTYGAGETIEVSVTFTEAVNATSDTDFELNVSGDRSAPLVRGSGTATLVFGYTVVSSDDDDNGIWIGDQDRTLVGARRLMAQSGTITSVASSTAADLTHAELGQLSDHKVDGSRSIVSVEVTSTPALETDTYGAGETIRFTVTFSAAVNIGGSPVFRFSLGNLGVGQQVDAAYESGAGSAALVFGYTVVSSDEDDDGIWIGHQGQTLVGTHQTGTITIVATSEAAGIEHAALGVQTGHKVDGSRTTGNNPPVFTSSASLSVEENTTNATVVAVDNDTDDDITGYAITGGTDEGFFSDVTSAGVLTFNEAPNFEDPQDSGTDNTYVVTVEATSGTGTREMTATQTITVTVTDAEEKSAKPDKPTLAKVTGSSTSLTATWTKPDLDGGPDITGYALEYREGTTGTWTNFAHSGTAITTTVTGLTADTSYQVQVRAKNGETDSDWSEASDAVKTNAAATAPTISTVVVTSTPVLETDTYGAGETIEVSVTFDEAVNATSDTDFELNVSGDKSAPLLRGSGTATLVFGYTVVSSDDDDNGIWIGDQDRTLVGARRLMAQSGTITSVASSTAADLTHAELGQQSDHKVDGSRSIVSVAVTSTPMLETDTYGAGETIRFTVTFSAAVNIGGSPVFRFSLGNLGVGRQVDAAYESGAGSAALVFGYTVVSSDEDDDGIWIGHQGQTLVGTHQTGTITIVATSEAAGIEHAALGVQTGHKVDGSRTTGNNAPVFTSSASLSVEENTTNATVVAVDNDTDDDITGYAITGGTDQAFFSEVTSAGVLTFNEAPNFEDPQDSGTDNTYVVTVEATSGTGTREMTATQTITVTVTDADEKPAKPDKPTLAAVAGSSTSLTATWTKPDLNGGPEIAGYDVTYRVGTMGTWESFVHIPPTVTTTITGLTANTAYQARVRAVNEEALSDWSDASDAVKTNAETVTPTCTPNPGDLWCGVVTVGNGTTFDGYDQQSSLGDLSDRTFSVGTNNYTIDSIYVQSEFNSGTLAFVLMSGLTSADLPKLVLHFDSAEYEFSDATIDTFGLGYRWDAGLDWSSETSVTLRLREREDPAADASLSALTVTHSGDVTVPLGPAFAPGITRYGANVANPVDEVTVAAEATVAGARVRYLAADGTAIADTDTGTPGREVALAVGHTVVQVEVTATDGTTMRTYRVRVTRLSAGAVGTEGHLSLTEEELYADEDNGRYGGTMGRVRVTHAGALGTVCSDGIRHGSFSTFDHDAMGELIMDADGNPTETEQENEAAALICKAMNYDDGEYYMKFSKYRPGAAERDHQDADYWPPGSIYPVDGPTPIWIDELRCVDGDPALGTDPLPGAMSHCSYAGWGLHNGTHEEDAVVRCWNNDPGGAGIKSLKGRFVSAPERHDGTNRVQVRVAFSEPVEESPEEVGAHGVEVEGGDVTSASAVGGAAPGGAGTRSAGGRNAGGDDREVVWEFEIEPDSDGDLTVTLAAGRPCGEPGAICTADGRALSEGISTTVEGPDTGPPPLTASFEDMPEAHDGESAFRFRVAFSENIGISFRSLREDAFAVAGGRVTRGKRVDDRRDLFEMTVEPDGEGEVTVTLPAGRECTVSGAICTKGENRRQLTNAPTATVAGPAVEGGPAGLTARFARVPSEHDGKTAFKLRIAFSEEIRMSGRRLRSDVVAVSGGRATKAGRVKGRKDLWKLTVRPDSLADVTVTLEAGAACDSPEAVCTSDGRALSNTVSATVKGPVAVSVADARAREGEDETIDFAVSLSRAASGRVSVAYATADGTATAGSDYRARQGKLKFAAGETEKTISVPVLDDVVDEGEETFTLRLLNASGAVVADGEATGTIVNSDPLQKMWLSRFGRTVAGQVVDAVAGRLSGSSGGSRVTLGGRSIDLSAPSADTVDARRTLAGALGAERGAEDDDPLAGPGAWEAARAGSWDDPETGATARTLTGRELLLGSSFHLAAGGGEAGGPGYAAWGRVAVGGFDAEAPADGGTVRLDGEVTTGILGADAQWERWLAGVALSVSSAEGSFDQPGVDSGTVESTLTSVNPYVRYEASDRLSAWGLLGYGTGDMTIRGKSPVRTDLMLRLGAAGARGVLLEADEDGGIDLALRGDAFLVQMESEAAANTVETKADASRLRLVLEAGRSFALGEGAVLAPALELGLRHDGGDAETGTGVEVGGRIRYTDTGSGLTVEANARKLIAHEDSGYEEWGAGGSVRLGPDASGRGLSLSLAPVWGTPSSGVDRLWSARDAAGLVRDDDFEAESRLEGELGYGFGAFGQRGVVTPYAGFGLAEAGDRTWRAGARWSLAPHLAMSLDGARREPANDDAPEHGVRFGLTLRW